MICMLGGLNIYLNQAVKIADAFLSEAEALAYNEGTEVENADGYTEPCDMYFIPGVEDKEHGGTMDIYTTDQDFAFSFQPEYNVALLPGSVSHCPYYFKGNTCTARDCWMEGF